MTHDGVADAVDGGDGTDGDDDAHLSIYLRFNIVHCLRLLHCHYNACEKRWLKLVLLT